MAFIALRNVYYKYPSSRDWAIVDVTLETKAGRILLAGNTGSGKSTLLRVISGIALKVYGGELRGSLQVDGVPVMVPQNFDAYILMPTPRSEILYVLENRGLARAEAVQLLNSIARSLGIEHVLDRSVSSLSMGERQRVAVASALALAPDILLLDEPFAYIDPQGVLEMLKSIEESSTGTIIVAEHRVHYLTGWANEIAVMDRGRLVFHGHPADLKTAAYSSREESLSWYALALYGLEAIGHDKVEGCLG